MKIYIENALLTHRKILVAGGLVGGNAGAQRAFWLYVAGLGFARQHLTDGFIPGEYLANVGVEKETKRLANILSSPRVKLWRKVKGGYRIHDYLDHNKNAAAVRELRAKWRAKHAAQRHGGNGRMSSMAPGATAGAAPGAASIAPARSRVPCTHVPMYPVRASTSNQLQVEKSVRIRTTSKNTRRASRVACLHEGQNAKTADHVTATVRTRQSAPGGRPEHRRCRVAGANQTSLDRSRVDVPDEPGRHRNRHDASRTSGGARVGSTPGAVCHAERTSRPAAVVPRGSAPDIDTHRHDTQDQGHDPVDAHRLVDDATTGRPTTRDANRPASDRRSGPAVRSRGRQWAA